MLMRGFLVALSSPAASSLVRSCILSNDIMSPLGDFT